MDDVGPVRMCVACRRRRDKRLLLRFGQAVGAAGICDLRHVRRGKSAPQTRVGEILPCGTVLRLHTACASTVGREAGSWTDIPLGIVTDGRGVYCCFDTGCYRKALKRRALAKPVS